MTSRAIDRQPDTSFRFTESLLRLLQRSLNDGRRAILVILCLSAACAFNQFSAILNHDSAWLIHGTEVFLNGGRLYVDVFELNPPLIIYLTVPPVWVAKQLHASSIDVFVLYIFLLAVVSLSLIWLTLRETPRLSPFVRNGILIAVTPVLVLYPAADFGQREHLMVILALPYLFLAATRARWQARDWRLAAAIGVLGAIGFSIKPHFLLVPLAAECYIAVRARSLRRLTRPETLAFAATVTAYVVTIPVFTPEYLTTIVPFGMAVYDHGFDSPLWRVLLTPWVICLPAVLLFHLVLRKQLVIAEICDLLCLSAVCFLVIYAVQSKGWSYQAYPIMAMAVLALSVIFLNVTEKVLPGRPRGANATALRSLALCACVLILVMGTTASRERYSNETMLRLEPMVARLAPGASIYIFSVQVPDGFPLVNYTGVGWSSRFDELWLLPGLVVPGTDAAASASGIRMRGEIERYLRNAVAEDFTRRPPDLVFVDAAPRKSHFGGIDFDYIRYFSTDPRFATIWADYTMLGDIDRFQVFGRRPAAE